MIALLGSGPYTSCSQDSLCDVADAQPMNLAVVVQTAHGYFCSRRGLPNAFLHILARFVGRIPKVQSIILAHP